MKNITFSADEQTIEAARQRARREHSTLNLVFRRWLENYAGTENRVEEARAVLKELRKHVKTGGRKFTREEMNER